MNAKKIHMGLVLAWAMTTAGATDSQSTNIESIILSDPPPKIHNRKLVVLAETNQSVFRLDERSGDGVAWWPDTSFTNGTIEFEVRGTNTFQKSFVGVAFHGLDAMTYDAVYFRPFNFQSDEPLRRGHGVQYISHPTHTWSRLRDEQPGKFEQEVSPAPDPNGWLHVRIVVNHPTVRVFIDGAQKPILEVSQLNDRKRGWVGLWVGNGSGGDYANLKISPAP